MSKIVRLKKTRRRKSKAKSALVALLIVTLLILGAFIALVSIMKIQHVAIEGNTFYSDQQILTIVGIDEQTSVIQVQFDKIMDLSDYPYLNAIEIEYTSLTSIKIMVKEKEIIGYIPYAVSGYVSIDKEGYALEYVEIPDADLMVIEGIKIDQFTLGEIVELEDDVMKAFLMFSRGNQQYGIDINRIVVENEDLNHIVFYIDDITILFGSMNQFNEKMQKIQDVLPIIREQDMHLFDVEHNTLK